MKDDSGQASQRRTVTVPEAAIALGISRNSAYDAVKTGQLQVIKIGKRLLVPRAALDRMLDGAVASIPTDGRPVAV
jgi:excisionase family DNA binding protein